ncbi:MULTISPECIES: FadD3 family acyl-CoA ligase [unclassified Streptomyces]|uniref:FadD3 family acyl-CoA ligase n=1 Tax=unclassified Streptomyces TaxID=2593676 RepID=UPI00278C5F0C|nr:MULTISPECIES: FadD3 family acyl-CoA ligase [unclassified Streptomyces]
MDDGPLTIAGLADWAADAWGGEEALVHGGGDEALAYGRGPETPAYGRGSWTFEALRDAVDEAARALMAHGLAPGDRVGVWAVNSGRWVVAALGALAAGGVLVPVNTRYRGGEAADILRRARCRFLFTEHDFLGTDYRRMLDDSGRPLPDLERVVALHDDEDWTAFTGRAARVTAEARRARTDSVRPEDDADILFTSGTTGRPKGVVTTHGQTVRLYAAWAREVTLTRGDRYLLVNPFFHTFGYKAGIVACLLVGAAMLPEPVFDADRALRRVADDRVSVLTGAPTLFMTLLRHPDRASYDLSSLRMTGTGASNIPTRLIEEIREKLGVDLVYTAYGLTESDGTVTICPPTEPAHTLARTAGRALPGTEVRIDASSGEILTRGYHVMRGYLDDPAATAEAVDADGWLHTGDVGVLDERGFLTVTDRLKDMFVVGGFNAYPAEIEQALRAHPGIADVSVVGAPDARLGEVGVAFYVPSPDREAPADHAQLVSWARERLANFKVPRRFEPVPELPHNAAGKVDKTALRARAAAGEAMAG